MTRVKPLCLALILVLLGGRGFSADPATQTLLELQHQKMPKSWDYTYVYQRWNKAKSMPEAMEDSYLQSLDRQLAKLPADQPANLINRKRVMQEKNEYLGRLMHENVLHQRQRVRQSAGRIRFEALEDLGSPGDPKDPAEAKRIRRRRMGLYFTTDGKSMAEVDAENRLVTLVAARFAYPDLAALIRPKYALDFEQILKRKDAKLTTKNAGGETTLSLELGGFLHMEMAVSREDGAHLLREKIYTHKTRNEYKTLRDYRKVDGFWVPMRIEVEAPAWKESLQLEDVKINAPLADDLFDYTKAAGGDFEVMDARIHPPARYKLKDEH